MLSELKKSTAPCFVKSSKSLAKGFSVITGALDYGVPVSCFLICFPRSLSASNETFFGSKPNSLKSSSYEPVERLLSATISSFSP